MIQCKLIFRSDFDADAAGTAAAAYSAAAHGFPAIFMAVTTDPAAEAAAAPAAAGRAAASMFLLRFGMKRDFGAIKL